MVINMDDPFLLDGVFSGLMLVSRRVKLKPVTSQRVMICKTFFSPWNRKTVWSCLVLVIHGILVKVHSIQRFFKTSRINWTSTGWKNIRAMLSKYSMLRINEDFGSNRGTSLEF